MDKFVFVILHYITLEDTLECVQSIKCNIDYDNYEIVIVDNGSPNKSVSEIKKEYYDDKKVHIVELKENLGFAKGNNVGFKYAKEVLKADFIALINNDTVIEQKYFIRNIMTIFNKDNYYVLGPDIISLTDRGHQNPYKSQIYSKKRLIKDICFMSIYLILNYLGAEKFTLGIRKKLKKTSKFTNNNKRQINNGVLHGSCLIFSPLYVKSFNKICDKTFMYGEEDILFYICTKLNLKYIYEPSIKIYHKEASSTKEEVGAGDSKKLRFFYKNKVRSSYELLKIMKKDNNLTSILM